MTMENRNGQLPIFKWTRIEKAGGVQPRPSHGHRAVAIKDLMVVFGGGNEGLFDGLYVFDTVTNHWYNPRAAGDTSPGRAAFGFVVDSTRIICFGGMLEYGLYSNDIFELQASRWEWKKLRPCNLPHQAVPCPRLGHSFNLIGKKVYMFGGLTKNANETKPRYLNDLFLLELRENGTVAWGLPKISGVSPPPRESHSAVSYRDRYGHDKLIIYGGMNGNRLGDLWTLHLSSMHWTKELVCGKVPLPRSLHSATVVAHRMFVFGGWVPLISDDKNQENFFVNEREWKCSNELACLNLETMVWEELQIEAPEEHLPKARAGHCAVAMDCRIYIWSGRDGYKKAWNNQVCCKDLWYLEVARPSAISRTQLISSSTNFLEVNWPKVTGVTQYILQIMKYTPQHVENFPGNPLSLPPNIPPCVPIKMSSTKNPSSCPPNSTSLPPKPPKPLTAELTLSKHTPPVKSLNPEPMLTTPNLARSPQHNYPVSSPSTPCLPAHTLPFQVPSSVSLPTSASAAPQNHTSPVISSSLNVAPSTSDNSAPSTAPSPVSGAPSTTTTNPIVILVPPGSPNPPAVIQPPVPPVTKTFIPRPVRSTTSLTQTASSHIPVACAPVAPRHLPTTPTRATLLPVSTMMHSYSMPANNIRARNQPITLWPVRTGLSKSIASPSTELATPPASVGSQPTPATVVNPPTTVTSQFTIAGQLSASASQSSGVKINTRPVTIINPSQFKTLSGRDAKAQVVTPLTNRPRQRVITLTPATATSHLPNHTGKPLRFNVQKMPGSQSKNPCVIVQKAPVIVAKENIPKLGLSQGGQKTFYKLLNTSQGGSAIPPGTRVITIKRPVSLKGSDTVRTVSLEAHRIPQLMNTSYITSPLTRRPAPAVDDGTKPSTSNSLPVVKDSEPTGVCQSTTEVHNPSDQVLNPNHEIDEVNESHADSLKRPIDEQQLTTQEDSPILGKLLKLS